MVRTRTTEDALRSVRRYVASALGSPPWRVRLSQDARFQRPAALIQLPVPSPFTPGGVDTIQASASMYVQLFPENGSNSGESKMLAERAADKLTTALMIGVADYQDPTVRGYREMIPLWDFTDDEGEPLPLKGAASIATKRTAHDYLRVRPGWSVQAMPMAADDQLFVAIADLRVQWFRNTRLVTGPVLKEVPLELE